MKRIFDHPRIVVSVIAVLTVFFSFMVPRAQLDNDVLAFVPENHPASEAFERMDDLYDTSLAIVVGVRMRRGSILSVEGVTLVEELTAALEEIEGIDGVDSLTNIDYIAGTADGMQSGPMVESFGGTEREIAELRQRLRSWEMYDGALISADGRSSQIVVSLDAQLGPEERESIYFSIMEVTERFDTGRYEFFVSGEPALTVLMSTNMQADVTTLIPLVVVVVLVSLFIFFRRVGGVVLPLITVLISTVWTVGLMALLGVPLSLVATVIPVLMIAVGSAYGIHIVNHFYDEWRTVQGTERETIRAVVEHTLKRVGVPVLMAGITTIAGFGSLATSQVTPMRDFGIFTAIGVAVALLVALTLIPSLLLVAPPPRRTRSTTTDTSKTDTFERESAFIALLHRLFATRKRQILLWSLALAGIAAWGSSMVVIDNELIGYFKRDTTIRAADDFLREEFLGTRSFNINVIGNEPGAMTRPEALKAMNDLARWMEATYPQEVSRVISYSDFIKRMNQVMNIGVPSPEMSAWNNVADVGSRSAGGDDADGIDSFSAGGNDETDASASSGTGGDADTFTGFGSADDGFSADEGFSAGGFGSDDGFSAGGFGASDGFSAGSDDGFSTGTDDGLFGSALGAFDDEAAPNATPDSGTAISAGTTSSTAPGSAGAAAITASPEQIAALLTSALDLTAQNTVTGSELARLVARVTNLDGAAYYEVPYDPSRYPAETRDELQNLVTQYLLLYSGELGAWADDALEPTQARMSVQLRTTGNIFTRELTREIESYVADQFPEGYRVEIAGAAIVEQALTDLITNAQIMSIIVSLSLVFLIVTLQFRSLVAGLFGVVPLAFTLLLNFGLMGFAGIKLDISTAMVASIAIGIGIDYTIHFLSAYHHERLQTADKHVVEQRVFGTTGKAITFNALSVAGGFAVLVLSQFIPLMYMGALIALTMLTSSLASMTILPVMLDFFNPRFIRKGGPA